MGLRRARRLTWDSEAHQACLGGNEAAWQRILDHVDQLCTAEEDLTPGERDEVRASVTDLLWLDNMRRLRERPSPRAVPAYVRTLVRNAARHVRASSLRPLLESQMGTYPTHSAFDILPDERGPYTPSAGTSGVRSPPVWSRLELLQHCQRRLTAFQMRVVELRIAGHSHAATALKLGRTVAGVKGAWKAALRRLGSAKP